MLLKKRLQQFQFAAHNLSNLVVYRLRKRNRYMIFRRRHVYRLRKQNRYMISRRRPVYIFFVWPELVSQYTLYRSSN